MSVHIHLEKRYFIVDFDANGKPLRIKERKRYGTPPYDGWHNATYWHHKHHAIGGAKFLTARIIEAAKAKHVAL